MQLNLKVPDDLAEKMKMLSNSTGASMSNIARCAIKKLLPDTQTLIIDGKSYRGKLVETKIDYDHYWYGHYITTADQEIEADQQLSLPDGRAGRIIVQAVRFSPVDGEYQIAFIGISPLT